MVPPIVAPARPRSVGDDRAGRGANHPARKRSTGRTARQAANKRAGAATDQCAAQHAILPRVCTTSERQGNSNHDQCLTHPLPPESWRYAASLAADQLNGVNLTISRNNEPTTVATLPR